jgi:hypothetical protein
MERFNDGNGEQSARIRYLVRTYSEIVEAITRKNYVQNRYTAPYSSVPIIRKNMVEKQVDDFLSTCGSR